MSTTNTALMGHLARHGFSLDDDETAGPASAQGTAAAVLSQVTRYTSAVASGSAILRSILTNDTPSMVFVINDSANAIKVYPFAGENINGALNTPLSIAAGGFGFFSRVQATLDWRAAAFT